MSCFISNYVYGAEKQTKGWVCEIVLTLYTSYMMYPICLYHWYSISSGPQPITGGSTIIIITVVSMDKGNAVLQAYIYNNIIYHSSPRVTKQLRLVHLASRYMSTWNFQQPFE